jgi:hypothetical protein
MEKRAKRDSVFPFEKLDVWQVALDLADSVLLLLPQAQRSLNEVLLKAH